MRIFNGPVFGWLQENDTAAEMEAVAEVVAEGAVRTCDLADRAPTDMAQAACARIAKPALAVR